MASTHRHWKKGDQLSSEERQEKVVADLARLHRGFSTRFIEEANLPRQPVFAGSRRLERDKRRTIGRASNFAFLRAWTSMPRVNGTSMTRARLLTREHSSQPFTITCAAN